MHFGSPSQQGSPAERAAGNELSRPIVLGGPLVTAVRCSEPAVVVSAICRSGAHWEEAVADPIVFAGAVEWSGENPGISLKEAPDGPFVALASFFRVVLSPHGRGHALVLLQSPQEAHPPAERGNFCLSDNEPLARYLVAEFVAHFGAWKGLPGLGGLAHRRLDLVEAAGDPASSYSETVW